MSASEESRAEIASILLNNEKKREKELADLRARSRPLHELVVSEYFNVKEVISHAGATSFTPHSEMRMGGRSPVYDGGFTSELVLKVLPQNAGVPVRTLNFEGFSAVRAGDKILARIPRYGQEELDQPMFGNRFERPREVLYFDRKFEEKECAIEIGILGSSKEVLRTDRAVGYGKFVEPKPNS